MPADGGDRAVRIAAPDRFDHGPVLVVGAAHVRQGQRIFARQRPYPRGVLLHDPHGLTVVVPVGDVVVEGDVGDVELRVAACHGGVVARLLPRADLLDLGAGGIFGEVAHQI